MSDTFDAASRQMIIKEEVTSGEYVAPDYTTDFNIVFQDVDTITHDGGHDGGSNDADGQMGRGKSYSGMKQGSWTARADLKWSGDVLVAPKIFSAFEMCGWVKTEDGINPAKIEWTRRPACKTFSVDLPVWNCGDISSATGYADVFAGVKGTARIIAEDVGQPIRAEFTLSGKSGGQKNLTAGSMALPSGQDTTDCEVFLGTSYAKGSTLIQPYSIALDQNADIQPIKKADSITNGVKNGIDHYKIGNAEPQIELEAVKYDLASMDTVGDMFNNIVDGTNVIELEHFTITIEAVQNIGVEQQNTNETVTENMTLKINKIAIEQKA